MGFLRPVFSIVVFFCLFLLFVSVVWFLHCARIVELSLPSIFPRTNIREGVGELDLLSHLSDPRGCNSLAGDASIKNLLLQKTECARMTLIFCEKRGASLMMVTLSLLGGTAQVIGSCSCSKYGLWEACQSNNFNTSTGCACATECFGTAFDPEPGDLVAGTIPAALGSMSALTQLSIYENSLMSGTIPSSLGSLNMVRVLKLHNCQLSGTIPASIGSAVELQAVFQLELNSLTGTIPASICGIVSSSACYLGGGSMHFECPLPENCAAAITSCEATCYNYPVDCIGGWAPWDGCTSSCGGGQKTRTFSVTTAAAYGGDECAVTDGTSNLTICALDPCPVDCVGEWGPWSACASSCESNATRARTFAISAASHEGGAACVFADGDVDTSSSCSDMPCPVDCVGSWLPWSTCACDSANTIPTRTFAVYTPAQKGGANCQFGVLAVQFSAEPCLLVPCATDNSSATDPAEYAYSSNSLFVIVGTVSGGAVLAILIVTGVILYVQRKHKRSHHINPNHTVPLKATSVQMVEVEGDGETKEDLLLGLEVFLRADTSQWVMVKVIAEQLLKHNRLGGAMNTDRSQVEIEALKVCAQWLAESLLLRDQASDANTAHVYSKRVELLQQVQASVARADSTLECVLPGLLLSKDRFEKGSSAFLGRGASAVVSRGILADGAVRRDVAVKEISKTASPSQDRAMREFRLLSRLLQPQHSNIIEIFNVKSSGNAFYVIMQLCLFSIDIMPPTFQRFLLGGRDSEGPMVSDEDAVGKMVLNALVQDVVRGVAFLHSHQVAHCDIKVCERSHGHCFCNFDQRATKSTPPIP